jgi:predicted alpha/beta-hydrolase family hydrolase
MAGRKNIILIAVTIFLFYSVIGQAAETKILSTPQGARVEILQELPKGSGPFPVAILAAGQGYHMRLPLMEKLSKTLAANGIAVLRFDWAYFTKDPKQGKSSPDLSAEFEDMKTVVDFARGDQRFDQKRLMIGGKSLGSIMAWKVFRVAPDLRGCLLLTPICGAGKDSPLRLPTTEESYSGLAQETRPIGFILGENDPACIKPQLYRYVADSKGPIRVAIIGGDHTFRVGSSKDAETNPQTEKNTDLAVLLATDFVLNVLK